MLLHMNLALALMASLAITVTCQVIQPGCQEKCGNVTIPYPFGIGQACALDDSFMINCNYTSHPPTPTLASLKGSLPVINISLDGHLRKLTYVSHDCYNKSQLRDRHLAFSGLHKNYFSTLNKFTVVGCDTYAVINGSIDGRNYVSGCLSICTDESMVINGSCSGIGCCQISIPKRLSEFEVELTSYSNHTRVLNFNPCSYAFVAEPNYFNFSTSTLAKMPEQVPTVLDWAIGDKSCTEARKNMSSFACKQHSQCQNSDNGPGYRCNCSRGYTGNAYVPGGCVDVDECKDPSLNDCSYKCHNMEGNYACSCPNWFHGAGRRSGQGCLLNKRRIALVIIGDGVLLVLIVAGSLILYSFRRQRMQRRLEENFFNQNGGYILLDRIPRKEAGSINAIKIFKSEELKEATDNFSKARICGLGGFGTVYKGQLPNGSVVAIKKSKTVDQDQVEQFINEITVLSQINHKNVVRFLGCCLETPVPLLVYEFIRNGTLNDHLHNNHGPRMPWQTRLKIAAETAGVLAYLHSDHSPPIIHRDIKPTNILLDDDYTAKVSDFGASMLIPKNEEDMCTVIRGTLGYLDPEYLQSSQLTEKSDVYSFGVVLIELLTGLKVVSFERPKENRSLVMYFLSMTKADEIPGILDKAMVDEDNIESIKNVAKIAMTCVSVNAEERPTMKEVAMGLEGQSKKFKHKWDTSDPNIEEYHHLLREVSSSNCGSSIQMAEYSGIENDFVPSNIADGR